MSFDSTLDEGKFVQGSVARSRHLRQRQTKAESILWNALRNRQFYNLKFRRQVPMGKFVIDFLCIEKKMAIEVDGRVHEFMAKQKQDVRKVFFLEQQGFFLLRFTNDQVKNALSWVLEEIIRKAGINHNRVDQNILPLPEGEDR